MFIEINDKSYESGSLLRNYWKIYIDNQKKKFWRRLMRVKISQYFSSGPSVISAFGDTVEISTQLIRHKMLLFL